MFRVGDVVYNEILGEGTVVAVSNDEFIVKFSSNIHWFYLDGSFKEETDLRDKYKVTHKEIIRLDLE